MIKQLIIVLLVAFLCVSCDYRQIYNNCIEKPNKLVIDQFSFLSRFGRIATSNIDNNSFIDASNVAWELEQDGNWPIVIESNLSAPRSNICLYGFKVSSNYPDAIIPTWDQLWHHTTAVQINSPNATVVQASLNNVGDGIDLNGPSVKDWVINESLIKDAHDDCIEDDQKNSGTIEASLLDGCYVAFSARGTGPNNSTVNISNSLVRLKSFYAVFNPAKYPAPGHGGFFKWEVGSPKVNITSSIFRADSLPLHGDLEIPPGQCNNNQLVWLGKESINSLPKSLRDCFTITTDITIWDNAVSDWYTVHNQRY